MCCVLTGVSATAHLVPHRGDAVAILDSTSERDTYDKYLQGFWSWRKGQNWLQSDPSEDQRCRKIGDCVMLIQRSVEKTCEHVDKIYYVVDSSAMDGQLPLGEHATTIVSFQSNDTVATTQRLYVSKKYQPLT